MRRALALVLLALGAVVAFTLLRDAAAIFVRAPLDPNEGWNGYLALRAMAGVPLYGDPWLVNNYPPLSFYLVGVLGKLTGDMIFTGRLLSLTAFLVTGVSVAAIARRMGCGRGPVAFAALFFAAALLLASNYVAMDDPQLLGHALQLGALWLLWRASPKPIGGALLFAVSLFVKHSLVALPLTAALFLLWHDRRAAWRFIGAGLAAGIAGLVTFRFAAGQNLFVVLVTPRAASLENFTILAQLFLRWAGVPIVAAVAFLFSSRGEKPVQFVLLYLAIAVGVGAAFASGDGVDANIFFDAVLALGLGGALALQKFSGTRAAALALLMVAPLLFFAAMEFENSNFAYTPAFRGQAARDIAFLRNHPGPGLCEMLSLCLWAGKPATVDVFNTGEAFKTQARDDNMLARRVAAREFSALQFDSVETFSLGPRVEAAMARAYRLDHADDNGYFFVPR